MSEESGLQTIRAQGGIWENHRVEEVATPEAWSRNREMVLRFYNERRRALLEAAPNVGHLEIATHPHAQDRQRRSQQVSAAISQFPQPAKHRSGSLRVLGIRGDGHQTVDLQSRQGVEFEEFAQKAFGIPPEFGGLTRDIDLK